jgi:hypothetical protein
VEHAKAPVEVVEGPELVQGVGDEQVVVALILEDLRERRLVSGDGLPAPQAHVVLAPLNPAPEGKGAQTRVDPAPRRDGGDGLGVCLGEAQALSSEGVEVGGLDPGVAVGAYVVLSEAVYDHHDDVHPGPSLRKVVFGKPGEAAAPGGPEQGHTRRAGPRDLQEIPPR